MIRATEPPEKYMKNQRFGGRFSMSFSKNIVMLNWKGENIQWGSSFSEQ